MTRIRSPRELRIVVAHAPPPADAAGARFGQLLLQARQALIEPEREPPARPTTNGTTAAATTRRSRPARKRGIARP